MRFAYPAALSVARDVVTVTFPDVPGTITAGATEAEALAHAADALVTALSFLVERGEPVPRPSPARGRPLVSVPVLEAAKLALHQRMLELGMSNSELARRLDMDERQVRRLRDLLHRSHIGEVERALAALGVALDLGVRRAA